MKIYNLHEPSIEKEHNLILKKVLIGNEISTYGNYPEKCSSKIKFLTKSRHVVMLNSGSSALMVSFKSLGIERDDLIITSNYTFIATLNAIKMSGGEPWVFDTYPNSPSLNLQLVEETLKNKTFKKGKFYFFKKNKKRIHSICPIYVNGLLQDYKRIKKIAIKYNLKIINDCAGSFLTLCQNNDILNFSDITISSFNGNKCPSSGMGGCLITNHKKYFLFANNFANNFSTIKKYLHSDYGFNMRITNLHAALLYSELKMISKLIKKKNEITKNYFNYIKVNNKFSFFFTNSIREVIWINKLIFKKANDAKKMINYLKKRNINTGNFWIAMDQQPFLKKKVIFEKKFNNCTQIYSSKIVPLPSSIFLNKRDILYISNLINKYYKN